MSRIRADALAAHDAGLGILPIKGDGTKAPPFSWGEFQQTRPSREQVGTWFAGEAYTGFAAVCGPVSNNLECLDFDDAQTYRMFLDTAEAIGLGELLDRIRAGCEDATPDGGAHLPYYCEAVGRNVILAASPGPDPTRPKHEQVVLIETRAAGGYLIMPPSNGKVHPSGRAWRRVSGSVETIATITPDERELLFALARSFSQMPPEQERPAEAQRGTPGGDRPGDDFRRRHGTVEAFTELISRHGWQGKYERGGVAYYVRPGKDRGVSASFGHAGTDLFYVFSSSTEFEPGRGYNPFSIYAILEHGGDHTAAARELGRLGYGEQRRRPGPTAQGDATRQTASSGEEQEQTTFNLTDLGNAERLIAAHGADIRYCKLWAKWLVFDGRRWLIDNTMQVDRYARDVVRSILNEAANAEDLETRQKIAKHALASEQERRITGMMNLARTFVTIAPAELDRDVWLLNCGNGTIDLKTGKLRAHDRSDYITKLAPVDFDPEAQAPRWQRFMLQVADQDAEQVAFTRRALGYSLCGDQSERVLLICWGSGRNGKSAMMETIAATIGGDYAFTLPAETLMVRRGGDDDRLQQHRAALRGARFAVASETAEGARMNEALIKSLTGNDRITGRYLYGEPFEFDPTHTLWLSTNHKPVIKDTTNSTWDRVRLIPFSVRFVTHDECPDAPVELRANPTLRAELIEEAPGILAWLVAGCLEWRRSGIGTSRRIKDATREYRADEDLLGRFIEECCHVMKQAAIPATQLYGEYTKWSEQNGERPISQTAFGRALSERGFEKKRQRNGIEWLGLGLRINRAGADGVNGCVGCEPDFDKPSRIDIHSDSPRETIHNHTQPYTPEDEEAF